VRVLRGKFPLALRVPKTGDNRAPGKQYGNGNPRHKQPLEAVGSRPWFGADGAALRCLQQCLDPCTRQSYGVLRLQTAGDPCRHVLVAWGAQHPLDGC
jgi:hypothetical protein